MNAPGLKARFGDNSAACFCHSDEMSEDERRAPGERPGWVANGTIFVSVRIFHENGADTIGAHLRAQAAVTFPQAFIIAANVGARLIDGAAACSETVFAQQTRRLFQLFDLEHLAAETAFTAGFSGNVHLLRCFLFLAFLPRQQIAEGESLLL
jgi:hypothetical protein